MTASSMPSRGSTAIGFAVLVLSLGSAATSHALRAQTKSDESLADLADAASAGAAPQAEPPGGAPPDAHVALVKPRTRKVAVVRFTGRSADSLRQSVLEALSAHPDLEVIGQSDLDVATHHSAAMLDDPQKRIQVAAQMGLYAWIDGDTSAGTVTVTDAFGHTLATLTMDPERRPDLQAQEKLWPTVGRYLSDEGLRQYLLSGSRDAAERILAEQTKELGHQRDLAQKLAQQRAERLSNSHVRAAKLLTAQKEELAHQVELAAALAAKIEHERQAELARKADEERRAQQAAQAEAERQAMLAQQQQLAAASAAQQSPAYSGQPAVASSGGYNRGASWQATAQPVYAQPAPAYAQPAPAYAQPSYPASGSPYGGSASVAPSGPVPDVAGMSPETKRWLEERRARAAQAAGYAAASPPGH